MLQYLCNEYEIILKCIPNNGQVVKQILPSGCTYETFITFLFYASRHASPSRHYPGLRFAKVLGINVGRIK